MTCNTYQITNNLYGIETFMYVYIFFLSGRSKQITMYLYTLLYINIVTYKTDG